MSVIELYREALERRGYLADASQMRAVEPLQQLHEEWSACKARRSRLICFDEFHVNEIADAMAPTPGAAAS